jgi:hypothetical protein
LLHSTTITPSPWPVSYACRRTDTLHRLDPFTYLDEILRVLPYWPRDRYLELAPKHWSRTRGRLNPEELEAALSAFEIPPPDPAPPAEDRLAAT